MNSFPTYYRNLLLVLTVVLAFSHLANAGKLYKIIDEKTGKVTFSQFPPKEKSKDSTVVGVEVYGGSKLKVTGNGKYLYCGDISLGGSSYYKQKRPEQYVKELNRKIENWNKQLQRAEERLQKSDKYQTRASTSNYNKYESNSRKNERYGQYQENKQRQVKSMKQYNCAIDWAKEEINVVNNGVSPTRNNGKDTDSEKTRLDGLTKKHTQNMIRFCGAEPLFDPTTASGKKATKDWNRCVSPYKRDLRSIEREMRSLDY